MNDLFTQEDIAYLLGRGAQKRRHKDVEGKSFLVTGAGGTIGSQLVEDLLSSGAEKVVLVENSEYALYRVASKFPKAVPRLMSYGSPRMEEVLRTYAIDCVLHAGAYKHVPLVELNPVSGVENNVFEFEGLLRSMEAAHTPEVVVISSDKAVRPTNVMGATKALVERLAINCAVPKVSVVRFGNVLGSSGSVLALFEQQLLSGAPLTITHRDVERYFMSVAEAVGLVLASREVEGEVKILDMGQPVKIFDLAHRFLRLRKKPDHPYQITGLRPGEKMYEELVVGDCQLSATSVPRVMVDPTAHKPLPDLSSLHRYCHENDLLSLRQELKDLSIGYAPACGVVDPVFLRKQEETVLGMDDCFRAPDPGVAKPIASCP